MLFFTLKRILLRPTFLILLVVCAAAIALSATKTAVGSVPPAGVVDLADSVQSRRMVAYLEEQGFICGTDAEAMREQVRQGELDCAVILPADFSQRLEQGKLEECIRFISAPASYSPDLYKNHVAAAVFREYAPYLTAQMFEGTPVTQEEVLAQYEGMFADGYAFSFEMLTADGGAVPEDTRARSLTMGAAALLLFALILTAGADLMSASFRDALGRLGWSKTLAAVVLPGVLLRALCALLAGAVGLLLAGMPELLPALIGYTLLLTAVSLLLAAVLPDVKYLYILLPLLLIFSLALCPVFTDVTLVVPALARVRLCLPPYWLWLAAECPLPWLMAGLAALPISLGCLTARYAGPGRYQIKRQ